MSGNTTQRRMEPNVLPEGSGSNPVGSSSLREAASSLFSARGRQWLACSSAMITMTIVGTDNGWTTTSVLDLTTGARDLPLKITHDQYLWIVSLTVIGSMIGAFVGAQFADRRGRKYCLLLCSTLFTVGWLIVCAATTVPVLYLARVLLGIGIGIAQTINPMYVSEVADIKIRGALGVLIAVNVSIGSLLICVLGLWLSYKSLLLIPVAISFISLLSNTCFPETPYFLVTKRRKEQAYKSIAYYKDIVDPNQVKLELRALRKQTKYELHPESRYKLRQQSRNDMTLSSRIYHTSQSGHSFPSQSIREGYSDTVRMSDLHSPSISDSNSQFTSVVQSEVICQVHPQPTDELTLQPLRELHRPSTCEIHGPSTCEIHGPPTCEIHGPSTCEIHGPPTCEIHGPSTYEIHGPSTSDIHRPSTSGMHRPSTSGMHLPSTSGMHLPSTSDIHRPSTSGMHLPSTSDIHRPSTSGMHLPSTSDIHRPSTSGMHLPSTSDIHRPSTSGMHRPSTSDIHRPSTSGMHLPSTSGMHPPSTSDIHRPSTSGMHGPSTSDIHRPSTSGMHLPSTSDIHRPSTSGMHLPSTSDIHRPSTSGMHLPSTSDIHRPSTSGMHLPSTSDIHRPSTSGMHRSSTSDIHRPSTSGMHLPSTSGMHPPSTSDIHRPSTSGMHLPSTSGMHRPSTSGINLGTRSESHSRTRSDSRTQSNLRGSTATNEIYIERIKYTWLSKLQAILQGGNRKALFIMLVLIMAQHLSGNFITTQYLEVSFSETMIAIDPYRAMILVLLVRLVAGTLTTLTVDYLGRRKLLILSTLGSCFTLTILSIYLVLAEHKYVDSMVPILRIIDLLIYQVMFQIGLGMLPNVLLCEIFPSELKGFVGATIVIFDGIIGVIVSKLYQGIIDNVLSYQLFFIFAISCSLAFLMVFIWVPETKGKTYDQIETLLLGRNSNSSNEEARTYEMDIFRI